MALQYGVYKTIRTLSPRLQVKFRDISSKSPINRSDSEITPIKNMCNIIHSAILNVFLPYAAWVFTSTALLSKVDGFFEGSESSIVTTPNYNGASSLCRQNHNSSLHERHICYKSRLPQKWQTDWFLMSPLSLRDLTIICVGCVLSESAYSSAYLLSKNKRLHGIMCQKNVNPSIESYENNILPAEAHSCKSLTLASDSMSPSLIPGKRIESVIIIFTTCILAPIFEELLYRGYLFRQFSMIPNMYRSLPDPQLGTSCSENNSSLTKFMSRKISRKAICSTLSSSVVLLKSAILSALVFSVSHFDGKWAGGDALSDISSMMALGLSWTLCYVWSKNLAVPVILHMIWNGRVHFNM